MFKDKHLHVPIFAQIEAIVFKNFAMRIKRYYEQFTFFCVECFFFLLFLLLVQVLLLASCRVVKHTTNQTTCVAMQRIQGIITQKKLYFRQEMVKQTRET